MLFQMTHGLTAAAVPLGDAATVFMCVHCSRTQACLSQKQAPAEGNQMDVTGVFEAMGRFLRRRS